MIGKVPSSIGENFRFLVVEVLAQVSDLRTAFESGSSELAGRIVDRSGYADNLKMRVRDGCIAAIRKGKTSSSEALTLRAIESIAIDLERITKLCRDCVQQNAETGRGRWTRRRQHARLLRHVEDGIELVDEAMHSRDTDTAVKVTKVRGRISRAHKALFKAYTADLKSKSKPEPILTAIFMAQRICEMGGALQDIGDAIISSNLGQQLSSDRYKSLSATVEHLRGEGGDLTVAPLAQTRSGSAISGIAEAGADDDRYIAVFKDGKRRKLKEERDKVDQWNAIFPGLAPKILSYYKKDDSAALLIEHLPGLTFEQLLLHADPAVLTKAMGQLEKTLKKVWTKTRTKKPVAAQHMRQLAARLDEVYDVHRDFKNDGVVIGDLALSSFDTLRKACETVEDKIAPPFAVHIHGDFNIDNIIYDEQDKTIRFIDLHRSRDMDYVQDVAVFMVSNYRLRALDSEHRRRAEFAIGAMYDFARDFADKAGDKTFEVRLALGLARSLASSTRFILDRSVAKKMFWRSRYLMERVLDSDPKKPQDFTAPIKELFVG